MKPYAQERNAMTHTRFSICHNDDDPRDPNHRRVQLELRGLTPDTQRWYADGEPLDWAPMRGHAEDDLRHVYGDPVWDLREE
jgi:hypothetical protein